MARASGRALARAKKEARAERLRQRPENIGALGTGRARRERRRQERRRAGSKVIKRACFVAVSVMSSGQAVVDTQDGAGVVVS